jgi:hypothetical protein
MGVPPMKGLRNKEPDISGLTAKYHLLARQSTPVHGRVIYPPLPREWAARRAAAGEPAA